MRLNYFVIVKKQTGRYGEGAFQMDTKSLLVDVATKLFQQKGYKGTGLNEILAACQITKGALYHHFPNGKEELLLACLQSLHEAITADIESIFLQHPCTLDGAAAMIDKLIDDIKSGASVTGYTFSSMVSEMASLNEPVRNACGALYERIQDIYRQKLENDGFTKEAASNISLFLTASVEGALMLCQAQKSIQPLKTLSKTLPRLLKEF